jgi:hypothetical protein
VKSTGKSFPHKNEVKVGHSSHKFGGHVIGHVKGKPGSGMGSSKRIVNSLGK